TSKTIIVGALMIIAFGNGLFKGNLQALVGQLYDNETYAKLRDTGFQIFYMFINIGAMVAPFAAVGYPLPQAQQHPRRVGYGRIGSGHGIR
ncbi:MAG: hypothetical protein J6R73_08220, partial [Alistipes sp.]|nr:hypothetical protein [Alistipes sp.]